MSRGVGLSVDVDSVASHLEGYGLQPEGESGEVYERSIPRLLDLFSEFGARATFFLIAREAESHPETVRAIVAGGHEVASHTWSHPVPLTGLDDPELRREVQGSKEALEASAGVCVLGFRAPSFDVDRRVLEAVARAGYRYDASAFPSILLPLLRRSIARRAAGGGQRSPTRWRQILEPGEIHERLTAAGRIIEIPMGTTVGLRLPYYHTLRFLLPGPAMGLLGAGARLRRGRLRYLLHAVDVLGLIEDRLDPRMARHPGMGLPLDEKVVQLRRALTDLRRTGPIVPLRELLPEA